MNARIRSVGRGALLGLLLGAASLAAAAPDCSKSPGDVPGQNAGLNGKIQHIVILMQENRSWDSYFGTIDIPQCDPSSPVEPCVDKLAGDGTQNNNPDPTNLSGTPISTFHQTKYCTEDTAHGWSASHTEFNRANPDAQCADTSCGLNDGFTTANASTGDPTGHRAMGHYDATDINYYHALVKTFAFGDRYFSSLLGPTYPNREYLLAATTFGHVQNDLPPIPNGFPVDSIFSRLDAAGITWKDYFNNLPQAGLVYDSPNLHFVPWATFFTDLATCIVPELCQLPQVSIIDNLFTIVAPTGLESTDEHPRNDMQEGQLVVAATIKALIASPVWNQSVLFLTYDEAGGFYDHVVPPPACVPDTYAPGTCADNPGGPNGGCTNLGQPSAQGLGGLTAGFDRYGFRTPNAVVSPWVKPGYVSHQVHDHTSILRFIETRFGLGALTSRDANASDMLDFFDFGKATIEEQLTPTQLLTSLPVPAFDPLKAVECIGEGITMSDELPQP